MASTPQFTTTPRVVCVRMSAGNTARDGSGTLYKLDLGRANGTLVAWIAFQALGPTNPGALRVFIDGQLFQEVATQGQAVGSMVAEAHALEFPSSQPVILGEGQVLQVSTNNAESWNVIGFMGDF
ncbi:MAG TPA: hypothetical protein VFW40_06240 [Capsulimonadaceae bacterium]|nr:hypothetical protein [Capsulimonadaceae bacterium]